jgi:copper chaperone CopZ
MIARSKQLLVKTILPGTMTGTSSGRLIYQLQALAYCSILVCLICARPNNCLADWTESPKDHTAASDNNQPDALPRLRTMAITVTGSMCTACLKKLKDKLSEIDGVSEVEVTPPEKQKSFSRKDEIHRKHRKAHVQLTYDANKIQPKAIVDSIKQNDFDVVSISVGRKIKD